MIGKQKNLMNVLQRIDLLSIVLMFSIIINDSLHFNELITVLCRLMAQSI